MKLFRLTKLVLCLFFLMGIRELYAQDLKYKNLKQIDSLAQPGDWYDPCTWGDFEIKGSTIVQGYTSPLGVTMATAGYVLVRYDIDEKEGSWMTCPIADWYIEGGFFYNYELGKEPYFTEYKRVNADVDRIGMFGEKYTIGRTVWVLWMASDKPITRKISCQMKTGCITPCFPKVRTLNVTVLPDGKGGYYENSFITSAGFKKCTGNSNNTANVNIANIFTPRYTDNYLKWEVSDGYEIWDSHKKEWVSGSIRNSYGITIRRKDPLSSEIKKCIVNASWHILFENDNLIHQYAPIIVDLDPCELTNTDIFIDDGAYVKEITKLVDHLDNVKIIGNNPTGGNVAATGYTYKWYISYDDGSFELIPNATGIDYILPFVRNSKTIVKRVTYTATYTKENTVTINLATCTRPSVGGDRYTAFICDNETIYNCIPGKEYQFKRILGSPWTSPQKSSDDFRFKWFISNDAVNYSTSSALTGGDNDHWWADYSFRFTKDWTAKQTIYVKRKLEEYYSPDIWTSKAWRNIQNSNVVTLTMYAFEDPKKLDLFVDGLKNIDCKTISTTYTLKNKATNQIVDVDKLGIKNIIWTVPTGWVIYYSQGKWATSVTPNTISQNDLTTNIPKGGTVTALVEFEDGQKIPYPITIIPPTPLQATITPNDIVVCNSTVQVSVTPTNGSGNYNYLWDKWFVTPNNANVVNINGAYVNLTDVVSVKITDATSGCYITKTVDVTNIGKSGQMGWAAYNFNSANNSQVVSLKNTTDIITENLGNPYYVGADGKIYYYQYMSRYWLNTSIPTSSSASGPLAIYEPTDGNRTIYYSITTGKLAYISATGGLMNWSASKLTAGNGVSGSLKIDANENVFYRHLNNSIYTSLNNYATGLFSIYPNSNFTVCNNRIYFVNTTGIISSSDYNGANVINYTSSPSTSNAVLPASAIIHDNAGNVYFTATDNKIYQIKYSTNNIVATSTSFKCNGKFSVNKQTGVLYAAALNNDIYQIYYSVKDGYWQPLLISIRQGGAAISTYPTSAAQFGAVTFRLPNVFYVSNDGIIRVVLYDTENSCVGANVRTSNGVSEVAPSDEYKPLDNQLNMRVYPNPATLNITVSYLIPSDANVKLSIQNTLGETVQYLIEEFTSSGDHKKEFNISNLQSGLYIISLKVGENITYVKLIVNK